MSKEKIPASRPSPRRTFIKGMAGTLGVGAIAAAGLASGAGSAAADPAHQHCVSTKMKLIRMSCIKGVWIEYYKYYCTVCLDTCGGELAVNTCVRC
ncbi:anaerobic selenocysteine-containing dehydrogenase [Psychromicrobium silvestre]|uniref:Anaerobic selenocysteine-containing dehydrogenase n=1 Tax=Psychromicrobium silvestre TaxID=1645614 RepID=A0A7Y9LSE9_9MICC|nr:anaerobic selenocysteine-containing dehydrogenase [Psychromicrobium silvestre]